jgi:hypothetical protein
MAVYLGRVPREKDATALAISRGLSISAKRDAIGPLVPEGLRIHAYCHRRVYEFRRHRVHPDVQPAPSSFAMPL